MHVFIRAHMQAFIYAYKKTIKPETHLMPSKPSSEPLIVKTGARA